jgi:hypothetical protein
MSFSIDNINKKNVEFILFEILVTRNFKVDIDREEDPSYALLVLTI